MQNENGCHVWTGSINFYGYGQFSFEGRSWSTHRLAYELANGAIPQDATKWWVLHTCDNPACCNPQHLYLGDAKDNSIDMIDRKRQRMGYKRYGGGESIRFGRVFYEISGEIKTIFEWAEFFNVNPSTLEQRIAAGWPEQDLGLSSKVYKRHVKSEGQTKYKRFSGLKEVEEYKSETPVAVTTEASISTNRDGIIDMTNLAINHAVCTNPVVIADISINQDSEGRHSLNDLHKAAGGQRRHEPKNWLNNQQTQELIGVIVNTGMSVFSPITSKRGCKGGTYVCKELVYAYATWVSAEFFLKVIRAYDALVSGDTKKAEEIATTRDDRTPLRGITNRIMGKYGVTCQAVYKLVHKEFGVKHIDELSAKQTSEAIEYLAGKVIEGEFMGKELLPAPITKQLSDEELLQLSLMWMWGDRARKMSKKIYPAIRDMESRWAGNFYDLAYETTATFDNARRILEKATADISHATAQKMRRDSILSYLRGEKSEEIH